MDKPGTLNGYNDILKEVVTKKIEEIHGRKVGKVEPSIVTLMELTREINTDVRKALNSLFKEGKIRVGDTINDKYIVLTSLENK